MYFMNREHEDFYCQKIGQVERQDPYINSLIYLLASNEETRNNFGKIYDMENNVIKIDSLKLPWQTSTSINVCRLAFNLFGDITSDNLKEQGSHLYTVSNIFESLDKNIGIEALKIRF